MSGPKTPKKKLRAFEIIREVQLIVDMGFYVNGSAPAPERKRELQAAALKLQRRFLMLEQNHNPDAAIFRDLLAGALAYLRVISRARGESLSEVLGQVEEQMVARGVSW